MMVKTLGTKEWAKENFNISMGCMNDCLYCYAKAMADKYNRISRPFWKHMQNKTFEKIDKQIHKVKNDDPNLYDIMFPSSHDLFEENLEKAVYALNGLLKAGNTVLIVTKPRISVISELLYSFADYKDKILFRFTITTCDNTVKDYWEKNAPAIRERMICLYLAYSSGFKTSVSIEPFLDNTVVALVKNVHPYVTNDIWVGPMNFSHVPEEYIREVNQDLYYTKENLQTIKEMIDSLGFKNIRYKDHFLKILRS